EGPVFGPRRLVLLRELFAAGTWTSEGINTGWRHLELARHSLGRNNGNGAAEAVPSEDDIAASTSLHGVLDDTPGYVRGQLEPGMKALGGRERVEIGDPIGNHEGVRTGESNDGGILSRGDDAMGSRDWKNGIGRG